MAEAGAFYKNLEFHDMTLLLGSDSVLLEQCHVALQATFHSAHQTSTLWARATARLARWQYCKNVMSCFQRISGSASFEQAYFAGPAAPYLVEQIPAHRVILSSGSDYFKTALSTLVGQEEERLCHPIIVLHEEDVKAAEGVLQFLYTKVLDSKYNTVPQLMTVMLVSG